MNKPLVAFSLVLALLISLATAMPSCLRAVAPQVRARAEAVSTPEPATPPAVPIFVPASTDASRRYKGKVIIGVAPHKGVKAVAVCFDDGPGPYRAALVAICKKYGVSATFYDVESRETRRAVAITTAAGCEIQSHTDTHSSFIGQTSVLVGFRLRTSQEKFVALGVTPRYVRFPYNSVRPANMSQIATMGLTYTGQYKMTRDYRGISVNKILASYKSTPNGAIVLSHDYTKNGPAAFERYVKYCKAHGIALVSVSTLLGSSTGVPVTSMTQATHRVRSHGHWVRVKYWKYVLA